MRSPRALKCPTAGRVPGSAETHGRADKENGDGNGVECIPIETCGRMWLAAERVLWRMARAAPRNVKDRNPARVAMMLRQTRQRAVLRATADVAMLAVFGSVFGRHRLFHAERVRTLLRVVIFLQRQSDRATERQSDRATERQSDRATEEEQEQGHGTQTGTGDKDRRQRLKTETETARVRCQLRAIFEVRERAPW